MIYDNEFNYDDDYPAGGHWPGARNFISLAELSGVTPERSDGLTARQRRMSHRYAPWPAVISLKELSGVAPERPSPPAIDMAAVRDLVDEKRRAMSATEWAKATDDGAMVARGLRALKTLPDPQAAMPAFRRKMAEMGVTEGTIASLPRTWDPRLADVVIAAHGEMGKLPTPPSRAPRVHGTQAGAGFFGAPRRTEEDARLAPSHAPGAFTDPIPATISSDDRMGDMGSDDGAAYLIGSVARAPQDAYGAFFRVREQHLARERGDISPPIVNAGPPTDEPIDADEMYKRLAFDPNGSHYAWEAAKNPIAGAMSYFSKEKSKARTEELVKDGTFSRESLHNGEADAFRHAYWSYLMAQELGPDFAKRITDAYEASCPSSKQMGLLSVFHKGGSGSSLFDVKPLGFDGSSGGFGWSVF